MKKLVVATVLLCASCAWLNDGTLRDVGRALQHTGGAIQSVPLPIAQPIGLAISLLGLAVSAFGKIQKNPQLVRVGGIGVVGGVGMAGTSVALEDEVPALVSPSPEVAPEDHHILVPSDPVQDELLDTIPQK